MQRPAELVAGQIQSPVVQVPEYPSKIVKMRLTARRPAVCRRKRAPWSG